MTVAELLDLLHDVPPDTEVRLAQQPHWPFEYSVGEVVRVQVGGPEEGDTVTYKDDQGAQHAAVVKDTTEDGVLVEEENGGVRHVPYHQIIGHLDIEDVLYIGEGAQLGYLPGMASHALGWK